jgi:ataxin 2/2L
MQYHPAHAQQLPAVQQTYHQQSIRMYQHDSQQQPHITSYLVPTPPSTTPSPGQPHQQSFHPGQQPSPAAQGPAQAFPTQGPTQYVMFMPAAPTYAHQFSNQHNQPLQVVMGQQQQHPAQ